MSRGYLVKRADPPTDRKLQIVELVVRGFTTKEIAQELGISDHTVKNHLTIILAMYEVRTRVDLAVMAVVNGWVPVSLLGDREGHSDGQGGAEGPGKDSTHVE